MRVLLKGGLGNQLFQFCYLHFLHDSKHEKIGISLDPNPRMDRPFMLERLIDCCSHIDRDVTTQETFLLSLRMRLVKVRFFRGIIYRFQKSSLVTEACEYSFSAKILRKRGKSVFVGYFQHWKYAESAWENFGPEILAALNRHVKPECSLNDYLVVHVRGGDYNWQSHKQYGILKRSYYDNAIQIVLTTLKLSKIAIFVITDDPDAADQIFQGNSEVKIIGPAELDEWGCLGLMSGAKAVITANSTLSWWGGFLSFKNGGIMVIPNPWFAEWGERVGSAFAHPGVLQVDSNFRE